MRRVIILMMALGVLAVPSMASAHNATLTADCEAAHFVWTSFPTEGTNTATYFVQVDSQTPQQGDYSFTGSSGAKDVPLLLTKIGGTHTIVLKSTWTADNGGQANATVIVDCGRVTPPTDTPVTPNDTPLPQTIPPPEVTTVTKQRTTSTHKSCKYGVKRYSSTGKRLRDSRGHRIALCKSAPKVHVRQPQFTG